MHIFPYKRVVFETSNSLDELSKLLYHAIDQHNNMEGDGNYFFNGIISEDGFIISPKVKKGNAFIPKICGEFIPVDSGCCLICSFNLFTSTKLFLSFWTLIALVTFFVATTKLHSPTNAILALAFLGLNFVVTYISFRRQCGKAENMLHSIIFTN